MERGSVPAASGCKILDQRAVAFRDAPVRTVIPGHPFVAEREGAGAARVSRVVALDHSGDRPPHLVVSPIGKMPLQKFGDRQIGVHLAQSLIEPAHMRRRRIVGRQLARARAPSRAAARQQREPRFAHQSSRHRRGAVNKFCAAFSGVAKFLGGQRVDAPAASVSRLEDCHPFARAHELAGRHQARSTSADDQKMR